MELQYKLSHSDFLAMMQSPYRKGAGRLRGKLNKGINVLFYALGLLALLLDVLWLLGEREQRPALWFLIWIAGALGVFITHHYIIPLYYRWYFNRGKYDSESTVLFSNEGITVRSDDFNMDIAPHSIMAIERTKNHYFIWISEIQALIGPDHVIAKDKEQDFKKAILNINDEALIFGLIA